MLFKFIVSIFGFCVCMHASGNNCQQESITFKYVWTRNYKEGTPEAGLTRVFSMMSNNNSGTAEESVYVGSENSANGASQELSKEFDREKNLIIAYFGKKGKLNILKEIDRIGIGGTDFLYFKALHQSEMFTNRNVRTVENENIYLFMAFQKNRFIKYYIKTYLRNPDSLILDFISERMNEICPQKPSGTKKLKIDIPPWTTVS